MVLSYTTSPAYHLIAEKDDSKAAAVFDEGNYLRGRGRRPSWPARPQPALADQFLRFMLSEDFQAEIPETNWMYPAVTPAQGLPKGFETLPMPKKALLLQRRRRRGGARSGAGRMARRAQPIALRLAAGAAAGLVAALVFGTLAAVALRAEAPAALAPRRLGGGAVHADAGGAVGADLAARWRCRWRGRCRGAASPAAGLLIAALGAPFLLPVIVADLRPAGAVSAAAGWSTPRWPALGLPPVDIYGLHGVVLAHVFFNLPLATRLILQGWDGDPGRELPAGRGAVAGRPPAVPRGRMRRCCGRGLPGALRGGVPAVPDQLCRGAGAGRRPARPPPSNWRSIRRSASISTSGRAALLALIQVGLGLGGGAGRAGRARSPSAGPGLAPAVRRWDGGGWRRWADAALILVAGPVPRRCRSALVRRRGPAAALPCLPPGLWLPGAALAGGGAGGDGADPGAGAAAGAAASAPARGSRAARLAEALARCRSPPRRWCWAPGCS